MNLRGLPLTLRSLVLVAGLVVLIFSNDEKSSFLYQMTGVTLLGSSAAICLISGRMRFQPLTMGDVMFLLVVLLSLLATAVQQTLYTFIYTGAFLAAYVSIMIIVRTMSDEEFVLTILFTIMTALSLLLVAEGAVMAHSLTPGAWNRWELRFEPFGLHPDLTGYVYGGFVVLLLFAPTPKGGALRSLNTIRLGFAGVSLLVILAASARGGLLAVVVTLSAYIVRAVLFNPRRRGYVVVGVGVAIAGLAIFWPQFEAYMREILELDSRTRGIGSGGTGRFEIWAHGIDVLLARSYELLIGTGLRSSSYTLLGFSTENSYITIFIESGLVLGFALVGMLFLLLHMTGKGEIKHRNEFDRMAFYCVLFAMAQSMFNRYLIAIGNPFSLIFLLVVSRAFLNHAMEKRTLLRMRSGRLVRQDIMATREPVKTHR